MLAAKQLAGNWSFERDLQNMLTPAASGVVTGMASFVLDGNDPNRLHYSEQGNFAVVSGINIPTKQEYFYVFDAAAQTITKHEVQQGLLGKALYTLNNNCANHICGNDLYIANYQFSQENCCEFTIQYLVHGPRKNYSSCTKYLKLFEK